MCIGGLVYMYVCTMVFIFCYYQNYNTKQYGVVRLSINNKTCIEEKQNNLHLL